MSNFSFLKSAFPGIIDDALEAEKNVYAKPRTSCIYARRVLEKTIKWIYENDSYVKHPYQDNLSALLHEPTFKETLEPRIFPKLQLIQKVGNIAAHTDKTINPSHALHITKELFHFLFWFYKIYTEWKKPPKFSFDPSKIPTPSSKPLLENQKLIEKLAQKLEEQDKVIEAQKEALESSSKEHERFKQEVTARKERNKIVADEHDYNEADTRKHFIDIMLQEAGWDLNSASVGMEYSVTGMPTPSGKGSVDYVLWGDNGLPLAVVEAKRLKKDAQPALHQGSLYADCLEKKFKQRPIIFTTNGYQTYIYDDLSYPKRLTQGFYKKAELELLIQRREDRKDIAKPHIDEEISGRYYQKLAIQNICANYNSKNRKSLIVMATGTGKTRTSVALVKLLIEASWVKKILFLADRNTLVRQAKNAFNRFLPSCTPHIIKSNARDPKARVYLSTYNTIMNCIDETRESEKRFSVGSFDLIIIDECHRSVYQKYRMIFDYFDSLLLGLTATPRDEVDRNTYELFEIEDGVPTYAYELEQAIDEKNLVPPRCISVPINFPQQGIKYDQLTEEEKNSYEVELYDEEKNSFPTRVDSGQINKVIFNKDTIDKVICLLMKKGQKVSGGDRLGKTIIFAKNIKHAQFIKERFDKLYPEYHGNFAQIIEHSDSYAQDWIDKFSEKYTSPHIALSVDMLDTGIDVPEVLNLVFFKTIRSKTKFWQMLGRGTRKCENLFGPGRDKADFWIFDICRNFEFFGEQPEGFDLRVAKSLTQKIFERRLDVIDALAKQNQVKVKESILRLRERLIDELHREVVNMNQNNVEVRRSLEHVDKYKDRNHWKKLDDENIFDIKKHIAGLPSELQPSHELAKRFDLVCHNLQLYLLNNQPKKIDEYAYKITKIAHSLEQKQSIPLISNKLKLILEVQTDAYWQDVNVSIVEELRIGLRELVQYVELNEKKIIYTDFEDHIEQEQDFDFNQILSGNDLKQYQIKTESFIKKHNDHITIQKLKRNQTITQLDIEELERFLFTAPEIESKERFEKAYGKVNLGLFIRSLVGLDRKAAKEAFSSFLNNRVLLAEQNQFINKIIDFLTKHGTMSPKLLYEAPFTEFDDNGLDGVFFKDEEADMIVSTIRRINKNTEGLAKMAH